MPTTINVNILVIFISYYTIYKQNKNICPVYQFFDIVLKMLNLYMYT